MSNCTKCKILLNEKNSFKRYGKRYGRPTSYCRACLNDYITERRLRLKREAINKFGNICHDCKISYPIQVYDFHHLDPTKKDFNWNKMRQISEKRREAELSKCILLCSNCHRIRHIQ